MSAPKEIIRLGQVEVRFLLDSTATGGTNTAFEFLVKPGAKVPAPHYHDGFDELIYGLEGALTVTADGVSHQIGAGDTLFVPRGIVHHFVNEGTETTRTLAVITPGLLGPEYFRELAALLTGGPPDIIKVGEIMYRHGLVAAPG